MYSSIDTLWVLLGAILVFFMQAGFAMLEAGFTRIKNSGNIVVKNVMDFAIGSIVFFVIGLGIMYGESIGGVIALPDFLSNNDYSSAFPSSAFILSQLVFCGTAATIASGAMAGRTKFFSYIAYSIAISAIIYPIAGHWAWNDNGWLAQMGFHDFAGGTVVHMVGGISGFVGAKLLGARIGKYDSKGKPRAIPGHNLVIAALGVFILWFGWFGFNGGATGSLTGDDTIEKAANILLNTNLAAAASAITCMFITKARYGKADISMILNGVVAGLVSITCGCDQVSPLASIVIGIVASLVMMYSIEFIEHILKVDDPVGACGVHGFCGAAGTILTGIFSIEKGVLYTGKWDFFGVQVLGVLCVGAFVFATMTIFFAIVKKTVGLRVSEKEEIDGLDFSEHGVRTSSGTTFVGEHSYSDARETSAKLEEVNIASENFAQEYPHLCVADGKIRNVVIITNPSKLEILKEALDHINITGMTVSHVSGCGIQKGHKSLYRSSDVDLQLLPKVKVEVVISTVPVELLVSTVKKVLHTGKVGDGKIFINEIERVIKVRTGQEGTLALE